MNGRSNSPAVVYGTCVSIGTIIGYVVAKDQFWVGSVVGTAVGFFIVNVMRRSNSNR
jgi:uncharacterized membrane protein (UPF0136 family)